MTPSATAWLWSAGAGTEHEDRALVAEAFWYDDTGKFTIEIPEGVLPFVLVEAFLREAARWCPPSLRNDVATRRLIYVPLVDEGVDVWRPVIAEVVGDQTFRIVGENISPDDEHWAFATGEVVRCEVTGSRMGRRALWPWAGMAHES